MSRFASLLALACTLASSAPPAVAAEPLGRLFFTPAQRASLDTARAQKTRSTVGTEEGVTEKPPPPPQPEHVTYGGLVRRSDGKTTVWLNDRASRRRTCAPARPSPGRYAPMAA